MKNPATASGNSSLNSGVQICQRDDALAILHCIKGSSALQAIARSTNAEFPARKTDGVVIT
jgi:hypothetical protein